YTPDRVAGRTVVFTTTNGTRALLALTGAQQIGVGAFVNAAAVVRWLTRAPGGVIFVCAGESGRFCLEDATCAGLMVERLRAARPGAAVSDAARAASLLYGRYPGGPGGMRAGRRGARRRTDQGGGGALPRCTALDILDVVPIARDGRLIRQMTPGATTTGVHDLREARPCDASGGLGRTPDAPPAEQQVRE